MTRRNAPTAGLIAAAVVILLWSGWRILQAQLTVATEIVAWGLWLLLTVAVATAVAYLRELVQQRGASRRVGWRPLPGVSLLWIAGLASVAVFGFLMPDAAGARADSSSPVADHSTPASTPSAPALPLATPTTPGASPTSAAQTARATAASRAHSRVVPVAAQPPAVTPRPVSTTSGQSAPAPTPTATSTTTSAPLITLPTLPNGKPKPRK